MTGVKRTKTCLSIAVTTYLVRALTLCSFYITEHKTSPLSRAQLKEYAQVGIIGKNMPVMVFIDIL